MRKKVIAKRLVSIVLTISMMILLSINAFADYFYDIPQLDVEYKDAINYVSDNGLMTGTSSQIFSPDSYVNRASFITLLYRMSEDSGNYHGSSIFNDVPLNSYYDAAVGWAYTVGITNGAANGLFKPLDLIDKAQAMVFLYRYASYKQYNTTDREDLSGYFDYYVVPDYAKNAMSWAYSFAILPFPDTFPGYIESLNNITRADCALMICHFIQNVRGFVVTSDGFRFDQYSFVVQHGDRRCISARDWSYLSPYSNINENTIFTGYCFGISVAVLLDFYGKIDLNGNYCNSVNKIYDIPKPGILNSSHHIITTDHLDSSIQISEVESKIALYQFSSALGFVANAVDCGQNTTGEQRLHQMVEDLKYGGAGLFKYEFIKENGETHAHAVVATGKPIRTNEGYKIALYDCNYPGSNNVWLMINTHCAAGQSPDNTTWTAKTMRNGVTVHDRIHNCRFQKDLSAFADLDVDGWYNDNQLLGDLLENYSIIEVDASNDFSINNSNGETIAFTNGEFTGTMDVAYYDFIPSSPEAPVTYILVVEPSESFTCTSSSMSAVSGMTIIQDEKQINVSGRDFEESRSVALRLD